MARVRAQEGNALLIALVLMLIMAAFATGTLAFVDTEQHQSAIGRQRETAFTVSEAALNAQMHTLSRPGQWPGAGGATLSTLRFPAACTQISNDPRCPPATSITNLFVSVDTGTPVTWTTMVRDNSGVPGAETFWNESMIGSSPTYDANGDGALWVRSQAVVRNRKRTIVALVRAELQEEELPHAAVIAGRMNITNNGKKVIVDERGTGAITGPTMVRCTPQMNEARPCLGHALGSTGFSSQDDLNALLDYQISPNVTVSGYGGGAAMTADQLDRLKRTAMSYGTYYTSCPPDLTGTLVFIDTPQSCAYTGNLVYNSPNQPGDLIVTHGNLTIGGGVVYWGLIYHANLDNASTDMVTVQGQAEIHGGCLVDGDGGLYAGSNKVNFTFDDRAFTNVRSFGTAGVIQNTWREIR